MQNSFPTWCGLHKMLLKYSRRELDFLLPLLGPWFLEDSFNFLSLRPYDARTNSHSPAEAVLVQGAFFNDNYVGCFLPNDIHKRFRKEDFLRFLPFPSLLAHIFKWLRRTLIFLRLDSDFPHAAAASFILRKFSELRRTTCGDFFPGSQ